MWKIIAKHREISIQLLHLFIFLKWFLLASLIGILVGGVASLFAHSLSFVTALRLRYPAIVWLLPLAGLTIVFMYRKTHHENPKGTNLVIASIRRDEKIPLAMAPLIFLSTVLTHLCGGSAGREGAALQLGGSIGQNIARYLHLNDKDQQILTMCAMSAAFAALFGTPLAATIFALEVISVGIMHYAALVPCALSSIWAAMIASGLGVAKETMTIHILPQSDWLTYIKVILLSALLAYLSIFFCYLLHKIQHLLQSRFPNSYQRMIYGSILVLLFALLFGSRYQGAGMDVIINVIENGQVLPQDFLIKAFFTAFTLACGFKGGEIVPSFFVGACFGGWIAGYLGLPTGLGGAIGLTVLFCGVTNCPLSALILSFELFNFSQATLFLIAVAIGYMLSGYYGLYTEQKIVYSKYHSGYIDRHANEQVD